MYRTAAGWRPDTGRETQFTTQPVCRSEFTHIGRRAFTRATTSMYRSLANISSKVMRLGFRLATGTPAGRQAQQTVPLISTSVLETGFIAGSGGLRGNILGGPFKEQHRATGDADKRRTRQGARMSINPWVGRE